MSLTLRFRGNRAAVVLVAGLLVVPMACGGDDDGADDAPTVDAPAEDAATVEITITDFAFGDTGPIEVGTTVIVRNDGAAQHTWTSVDDVFDSGILDAGDTFSFTFDDPGEYPYFCEFHPAMAGTVVVTD